MTTSISYRPYFRIAAPTAAGRIGTLTSPSAAKTTWCWLSADRSGMNTIVTTAAYTKIFIRARSSPVERRYRLTSAEIEPAAAASPRTVDGSWNRLMTYAGSIKKGLW